MKNAYSRYCVFPLVMAFSLCLLPLFIVACLLVGSKRAFTGVGHFWARGSLVISRVNVEVSGLANLEPGQSYIIVSNHGSEIDIPIIIQSLALNLKWVVKKELAFHPVIGPASWLMGNVFVDRRNSTKAIQSLESVKSKIQSGTSLLFFPEGTRSKIGRMLPFKTGAFRMAQQLGLPVLPLSVVNADKLMPSGQRYPNAGCVQLVVHTPVSVEDVQQTEPHLLADQVRRKIQSAVEPQLMN